MFRLWGRIWKDNHMLKDTVICDDRQETRTHKVFYCLEQICYELDLGNPIWLETTVRDFKKHSKTRFYQDNFIEQIDFDYLEIQVIEEGDYRCMVCNPPLVMSLNSFCFLPGVFFLRRGGSVRCGLRFWRLSVLLVSLDHFFQPLRPIALTA